MTSGTKESMLWTSEPPPTIAYTVAPQIEYEKFVFEFSKRKEFSLPFHCVTANFTMEGVWPYAG